MSLFINLLPTSVAWVLVVAPLMLCISESLADGGQPNFPKIPPSTTQSIVTENTNLAARDYLRALMNHSVEERRYAELYFLGVLDATEGAIWCDYKTYKTITIDSVVFSEMKKLNEQQLAERASTVIVGILKKKFPCAEVRRN